MDDFFIVTPARNETGRLPGLFESVRHQTVGPFLWVVVDDGSTDGTATMVDNADKSLRTDRVPLQHGQSSIDRYFHVVSTGIEYGLAKCEKMGVRVEFVGILDADVSLPQDYYEEVLRALQTDERAGIGSGVMYEKEGGEFKPFVDPWGHFIVAGAAVVYRLSCLRDIGGYPHTVAADSVTLCKAIARGWTPVVTSRTRFFHLRPESSLKRRVSMGRHYFSLGYHPIAAILTAAYYTVRGPNRLAGPAFWVGYSVAMLTGSVKVADQEVLDAYGKRRVKSIITNTFARMRGASTL
jgi:glycosyltransferase involved in cell wall biosynthesis